MLLARTTLFSWNYIVLSVISQCFLVCNTDEWIKFQSIYVHFIVHRLI